MNTITEQEGAKIIRDNYLLWNPHATEQEIVTEIRRHLGSEYKSTKSPLANKKRQTQYNHFRAYKGSSTLVFLSLCVTIFGLAGIAFLVMFIRLLAS